MEDQDIISGMGPGLIAGIGLGSDLLSNKGALRRQQLADVTNIKFWEMQNAIILQHNKWPDSKKQA